MTDFLNKQENQFPVEKIPNGKAWVVAVDMGYGHQRTAYPLKNLALSGEIIKANNYDGIPIGDRRLWENTRKLYELITRFKKMPVIGEVIFAIFNEFQKIPKFYPKRNLSGTNFQLRQTFSLIKKGWGKHLIEKLNKNPLPMITTFFTPAFMAEFFGYKGDIFCVICDADISRTWVSLKPAQSKIRYFAPTERVVERLKFYGVNSKNIFLTGYPLPEEIIGTENLEILKNDFAFRILNLDPHKNYFKRYEPAG